MCDCTVKGEGHLERHHFVAEGEVGGQLSPSVSLSSQSHTDMQSSCVLAGNRAVYVYVCVFFMFVYVGTNKYSASASLWPGLNHFSLDAYLMGNDTKGGHKVHKSNMA